ncbi:MAG: ATP-binding protein [Myxococcota bacterium]
MNTTQEPPSQRLVGVPGEVGDASSGVVGRAGAAGFDGEDLFRDVVEAVPIATLVLDRAGLVTAANRAFTELVQVPAAQSLGEPFLGWLSRASAREGFGRSFLGLRDKEPGSGFVLDVTIRPRLGPSADCVVRGTKLAGGWVAVTCHRATAKSTSPEADLGLAITRSLDALDQGVLLVATDGKVVHANPAGQGLLGEAIVGRNFLELADPASVPQLDRALRVARAGSWQGEVDLRRLDGEPLPVELSLAAGTGPAVVLLRDLRERRRRAFEERLMGQVDRCLVAAAEPRQSVMAACAALGSGLSARGVALLVRYQGAWQRWSLRGELPVPPVELPGLEVPAAWMDGTQVAPVDSEDEALARQLLAGTGDTPTARREGEPLPAVRVALRAPAGVVGQLLLCAGDDPWDERDHALIGVVASQIALGLANGLLTLETRELAAYQAQVLDQTTVLINSVDADGRVLTWNRAAEQIFGVTGEQAAGQRFGVDVARAQKPLHWDALWAELSDKGSVAREITMLSADDTAVPLHFEGRILRDDDGVRGAVVVGLDLRDRRGLERQVLKSQKLAAVGLLAAGIAHEINNPLSGVVGYSKLLLEKPLPEAIREKVEKIAASGERCRKIVEGVLLFSRQQDGGVRRTVDIKDLLDRVVAIGEYQWRMHNVRVIRDTESVEIMADADQLEQVVLNLLSNAVDAMPRGGSVRVRLRRCDDDSAELTVADEGHGIPEDIQARIFDPFFSTKEIGKGTGLGLAISYGIVQDHGGDIVVQSSQGRGAEFTVTLPPDGKPPAAPTQS